MIVKRLMDRDRRCASGAATVRERLWNRSATSVAEVVRLRSELSRVRLPIPLPHGRGSSQAVSRRGGLALMVVLVALAIVSAIGMSLLKSAISQHRQAARD